MVSPITGRTFKLFTNGSTTEIPATVSYDASTDTATLKPTNDLQSGVNYKAVVTTRTSPPDAPSGLRARRRHCWWTRRARSPRR